MAAALLAQRLVTLGVTMPVGPGPAGMIRDTRHTWEVFSVMAW
jgi:hypothetical protein